MHVDDATDRGFPLFKSSSVVFCLVAFYSERSDLSEGALEGLRKELLWATLMMVDCVS